MYCILKLEACAVWIIVGSRVKRPVTRDDDDNNNNSSNKTTTTTTTTTTS
jgi:hypothetical protein